MTRFVTPAELLVCRSPLTGLGVARCGQAVGIKWRRLGARAVCVLQIPLSANL